MLKRPSSRRKSHSDRIELNLVPILDAMVTLIGFLLFTTSFISIVSIESPLPQSKHQEEVNQLKETPLQLTLTLKDQETEIWSPFSRIDTQSIANTPRGLPDMKAIHEALIEIKRKFPSENSIVIIPQANTLYDHLIALMDVLRVLEPSDPTIYSKNARTGVDEPIQTLFPKVVFGNLLGDT